MRGPGANDVHRQFSLGPPSLLLRRHLEKKPLRLINLKIPIIDWSLKLTNDELG